VLESDRYVVFQAPTGTLALEMAREVRPDLIIVEADLPDMTGIEACQMLRSDVRIVHNVPVLILTPDKPTSEQRVAALRAGAWDFLCYPGGDPGQLSLELRTYVQAKRNIDVALAEAVVDPTTGLLSRPGLARRAKELGGLMARKHGGLACIVFAVETDPTASKVGSVVARTARVSDVVGAMGPTEFAVLAPATDDVGAVKLAQRLGGILRDTIGGGGRLAPGTTLRAGYEAVSNLKYSPIDPVELLTRATAAVRAGKPEPHCPWVRRFDVGAAGHRLGLVTD